jgi:pimeloyl-ACP methyl ester carboxylesterase
MALVETMSAFTRDGLSFRYRDEGSGLPFVFQHGLGGDLNQPFGLYQPAAGVRLIGMDMRGHGETRPLGDIAKLTIATLADDLVGLLDHLGIDQAVVGGISLGAAVAVSAALRYPERVRGLVLVRPAWIDDPLPANVRCYATIARLLRELGPVEGLARFRATREFRQMERESPDCARSLAGQFEAPRALESVARLERLASDSPCPHRGLYGKILIPVLILANRRDPIHPWELADELAGLMEFAELREVTSKSESVDRHAAQVRGAIDDFLRDRFIEGQVGSC